MSMKSDDTQLIAFRARRPRSCKLSTAPPLTKEFLEAMSCDEPRCVIYGVSMR